MGCASFSLAQKRKTTKYKMQAFSVNPSFESVLSQRRGLQAKTIILQGDHLHGGFVKPEEQLRSPPLVMENT